VRPTPATGGARRRAALLVTVTALLALAAVALLVAGVRVRETTGGLLVTPIRQIHLVGGFLVAGTGAGLAAVLCALPAVSAVRRARRRAAPDGSTPDERAASPIERPAVPPASEARTERRADGPRDRPERAFSTPGTDRST
jgi:hypothetical protein